MATSSFSGGVKKSSMAAAILKRTTGLIVDAGKEYFTEAMPTASNILSEATSTVKDVTSKFASSKSSISSRIKEVKSRASIKSVLNWYLSSEDAMDSDYGAAFDDSLQFDVDLGDNSDSATMAQVEITEGERVANKISKSVLESAHKSLEAQIDLVSDIKSSIDNQIATVTAGFDKVNDTLNKILEVVTKNSAAMIETVAASTERRESINDDMLRSGRFRLSDYKKMVAKNIKNNPYVSMASAFLPMISGMLSGPMAKEFLTPDNVVKTIFSAAMNKFAPSLKVGAESIDKLLSDSIMNALVRLGDNSAFGKGGWISKILGFRSDRTEFRGRMDTLSIKAVPFDTISKEAITNVIPGYLQRILVAVGGEDVVYDYRSRTFRTKSAVRNDFKKVSGASYGYAGEDTRKAFGMDKYGDNFGAMIYDIVTNSLGAQSQYVGARRNTITSFSNPDSFIKYVEDICHKSGFSLDKTEKARLREIAQNLSRGMSGGLDATIAMEVAKSTIMRNQELQEYIEEAKRYNVDLREYTTSSKDDVGTILREYGRIGGAEISGSGGRGLASSGDYTNRALYETYRLLNRGINVFQVGHDESQAAPYESWEDKYLKPPVSYRAPRTTTPQTASKEKPKIDRVISDEEAGPNLLQSQEGEELTRGERIGRWAKSRGSQLGSAIYHGDADQIRTQIGLIFKDISSVSGESIKKGISKINTEFGNVTGYLKHKLFGTAYTYQEKDEDGNIVTKEIAENDKHGIFGFVKDYVGDMFKGSKEKVTSWFKSVAGYFDYGDKDDKGIAGKRRKLLGSSVGALAGAGLLGGPFGLLMGALAGNALSAVGMGDKIKEFLFGRDEDGKAKGILARAVDGVVDPIKYQIGKTIHNVAGNLKKNILGPISDIGLAIKERVTSAAETQFGKVFKAIGNIILAPFKAAFKIAKFPIELAGSLLRGVTNVGSTAAGGILGGVASLIAGKDSVHTYTDENGEQKQMSTREWIKHRRAQRKQEIDDKYESYDAFKAAENARRARWGAKFKDYISERELTAEEKAAKAAEEQSKISAEIAATSKDTNDAVQNLNKLGSEVGSIYVHDEGAHDKLDQIISVIKSKDETRVNAETDEVLSNENETPTNTKNDRKSKEAILADTTIPKNHDEDESYGNAVLSSEVVAAMQGGLSDKDKRLLKKSIHEVSKPDTNNDAVTSTLTEMIDSQEEPKEEEEKKESIWSKIGGFLSKGVSFVGGIIKSAIDNISDILGGWGWVVVGIGTLINMLTEGDLLENVLSGAKDLIDTLLGRNGKGEDDPNNEGQDAVDKGVNMALSLVDAKVSDKTALFNPFASMYHADNAADGSWVEHQGATRAKNRWLLGVPAVQSITRPSAMTLKGIKYGKQASILEGQAMDLKDQFKDLKSQTKGLKRQSKDLLSQSDLAFAEASDFSKRASIANQDGQLDDFTSAIKSRDAAATRSSDLYDQSISAKTQSKELADQAADTKAKYKDARKEAKEARQKSDDMLAEADSMRANAGKDVVKNIKTSAAKVGIMTLSSWGAGKLVKRGAAKFGVDEDKAESYGNYATAIATAGLMVDQGISMLSGKSGILDKVLSAIKSAFEFMAKRFKTVNVLKAFGDKIDDFFGSIYNKTLGKMTEKIATKINQALVSRLGEEGAKQAIATAGLGIPIAIAGLSGIMSGLCGAAHLFQVKDTEVDGLMKTIASIETGVFDALEATPAVGFILAAFDVIDELVIKGICGKSLRQSLAEFLYNLLKGDKGVLLAAKQGRFDAQREQYNKAYGTALNEQTFNDLVNNSSWFNRVWRGKTQIDKQGNYVFDAAGGRIDGGIKGLLFGGEKSYVTDENGNILRREDGSAIVKVDKYGNVVKTKDKIGDKVGRGLKSIKRFFGGGNVYETDENGVAKVDENGRYVVKRQEANIFGKIGNFFSVIKQEQQYTLDMLKKPDSSFSDLLRITDEDPDDPTSGFMKTIRIGARLSVIPPLIMKKLGKVVSSFISKIFSKIANSQATLQRSNDALERVSATGDFSQIKALEIDEDPENPVGGFTRVAFGINKIFHYPKTALHWMGNRISEWFSGILEKYPSLNTILQGHNKMKKLANDGDVSGLTKYDTMMVDDKGNAAGGFVNAILSIDKITQYPTALIRWGGNKIVEAFSAFKNMISSDKGLHENTVKELGNLADQGDLSAIWNKSVTFNAADPLTPFWSASVLITKLFYTVTSMFTSLGKAIKNKLIDVGESIWSWIKKPFTDSDSNSSSSGGNTGGPNDNMPHTVENGMGGPSVEEDGNPINAQYRITSSYGTRIHPVSGKKKFHGGVDLVPKTYKKDVEVGSRFKGTVSKVTKHVRTNKKSEYGSASGGNQVWVDTDSGYRIKNMHLEYGSIPSNITVGTRVNVGTKLGLMGNTGSSTGRHLHYQMEKNGSTIDPASHIKRGSVMSSFTSTGISNSKPSSYTSDDSSGSSSNNSSNENSSENSGILAQLISKLTSLGSTFLSNITQGLISGGSSDLISNIINNETGTNSGDVPNVVDGDVESLWKYFKTLGYPDFTIAGILGCWTKESGNTAKRIEGDYSKRFNDILGYDRALNDRVAMDKFTTEVIFPEYSRIKLSINRNAYKAGDGHYYPGLGYAQWTGGRGKALLDFARSRKLSWYNAGTQMAYLDTELKGSYAKVLAAVNKATSPEEAAKLFCKKFEGYVKDSTSRQKAARQIYAAYHGKYDDLSAISGPTEPTPDKSEVVSNKKTDVKSDTKKTDNKSGKTSNTPTYGPVAPEDLTKTLKLRQAAFNMYKIKHPEAKSISEMPESFYQDFVKNTKVNDPNKSLIKPTTVIPSVISSPSSSTKGGSNNDKQAISENGIGGPDDEENLSTIRNSQYMPRDIVSNHSTKEGLKVNRSVPRYQPAASSRTIAPNTELISTSNNTDLTNVITLMNQIVTELARISQNTGSSSNLLESLNEKDFVDQGLRNSLNALGTVKKKSYTKGKSSTSTARSVASMARP